MTTECKNCGEVFEMPDPPTDTIYIPRCPVCDTVAEGFEENVEYQERVKEATNACKEIDRRVSGITARMNKEMGYVAPGSSIQALADAAEDLQRLAEFATEKAENCADTSE